LSVKIRLKRTGRKKRPFYRIVVMDSHTRRDGREIESLGWYDPLQSKNKLHLESDRTIYWLGQGAIPSDTVSGIMRRSGISYRMHLIRMGKSEDEVSLAMEAWETSKAERVETAKSQIDAPMPPTIELVKVSAGEDENLQAEDQPSEEAEDVAVVDNSTEDIKA